MPGQSGQPYRVVVLGGGVTGLSAAWELERTLGERVQVTILEQAERTGGWLRTERVGEGQIQLELGPRSFRTAAAGAVTLRVVHAIGLDGQLIGPDKKVSGRRLVWLDGRLNPVTLAYAVRTVGVLALLRETLNLRAPPPPGEVETIEEFGQRRFGAGIVPLMQAVCNGIFAGPISRLNLAACLPAMDAAERRSRSLIRDGLLGLFRRSAPEVPLPPPALARARANTLYSFRDGMEALPKALRAALRRTEVRTGARAEALLPGPIVAVRGGGQVRADFVICTLAPHAAAPLLGSLAAAGARGLEPGGGLRLLRDKVCGCAVARRGAEGVVTAVRGGGAGAAAEAVVGGLRVDVGDGDAEPCGPAPRSDALRAAAEALQRVEHASVAMLSIAGPSSAFTVPRHARGFGFLVPDSDAPLDGVLGATMDSLTFPGHHAGRPVAGSAPHVMTVMIGGTHDKVARKGGVRWLREADLKGTALAAVRKYAAVEVDEAAPGVFVKQTVLEDGVPQFRAGHRAMIADVRAAAAPYRVAIAGMAVRGVGVNDCIATGVAAAAEAVAAYGAATGRAAPVPAFEAESVLTRRVAEDELRRRRAEPLLPPRARAALCGAAAAASGAAALVGGIVGAQVLRIRCS